VLLDVEEAEQGIYEVAKKKIVKSMTPLCFTSLENFCLRKLHLRSTVILAELKGLLEQVTVIVESLLILSRTCPLWHLHSTSTPKV